jgi:magnesium-transporting ATPase (P-type)
MNEVRDLLAESVLYNCSAYLEKNDMGEMEAKGNCTEQGLLRFFMNQTETSFMLQKFTEKDHGIQASIPFDSKYKMGFTAVKHPNKSDLIRVYGKGGPDFIIPYCSHFLNDNAQKVELSDDKKKEIIKSVITEKFARRSYRTLLVAYRDFTTE